ncbi:ImmA/IrrE family metallo-endopeptidase [Streptococcus sp. 20-1249]|uniref:ImmA/IrrE family metallo-endopeptidase n=1 Tax=Streptococcus hepaticus TaxID=3349163 RepID=UPI003749B76F
MNPTYRRISDIAHQLIYHFIKSSDLQILSYNYNHYFQYIIDKYKIKSFSHHFDGEMILGVTMIDENGISISYEKNCIPTRQNFTKCHEIGHLLLEHSGTFFAEKKNSKDLQEIEADYFASFVLMPDIVLVSHIIYNQLSYQQLQAHLNVSNKALEVRLTHLLQTYTDLNYPLAKGAVSSFRANTASKHKLLNYINEFEQEIIQKYHSVQLEPLEQIQKLLQSKPFISQLDCKYIIEPELIKIVTEKFPKVKFNQYFDFGKTIKYLYNTEQLTEADAEQLAKNLIFNLIF